MNTIYLIRHGLIDRTNLELNNDGIAFSNKLVDILKNDKIRFIASSSTKRCVETISPLAKFHDLNISTYNKVEFYESLPLKNSLFYENSISVICYRIEEINHILEALNLELFTNENRDKTYEIIIKLKKKAYTVLDRYEIKSGFKKK